MSHLFAIVRATRASAAHLATATRHGRDARDAATEMQAVKRSMFRGFTSQATGRRVLAELEARRARAERLGAAALARHDRAFSFTRAPS